MRYQLSRAGVDPERASGSPVSVLPLFDDAHGCEKFVQRVLRLDGGHSGERSDPDRDEILFVLEGSGRLAVEGSKVDVTPELGVFVSRGTQWSIDAGSPVELVSVLVTDPQPAEPGAHAIVDLAAEGRRSATASRQFTLGVTPDTGCPSVTQFIGFIPPGRAPDHFHRYDEVIYVLDGAGTLHIDGEEAPLGPGACVHLPARLVHSLANDGDSEMRLLGVFRPGGSPAEAYYPDGSLAVYPEN